MRTGRGKTVGAILMTLGMLSAAAIPAVGKGKPAPEIVVVELAFDTAGIATACPTGPLSMRASRSGLARTDWEDQDEEVAMVFPIEWWRNHPTRVSGDGFGGCHGGLLDGSHDGFGGYFILEPDGSGGVRLTSRFDYYWKFDSIMRGNKARTVQTVLEFLEINADLRRTDGSDFISTPGGGPQEVSGSLELRRFEKIEDVSAWTWLGTTDVTLTITVRQP